MGDLTLNISRYELTCKCVGCSVRIQDHEPIIKIVQGVCDHIAALYRVDKVKLIITSAARCYEYNRSDDVGSNDESQHPRCSAIDFQIFVGDEKVSPERINYYLDVSYPDSLGLGQYNSFNHVDSRQIKARWKA